MEGEESKSEKLTIRSGGEIEEENQPNKSHMVLIISLVIIFVILIAAGVTIFLIFFLNNDDENDDKKEEDRWAESYKKAETFVSYLNLTEKINLLFGTENMKESEDKEEKRKLCVGKIDPFKNDQIEFKGLCAQDGPAGVRFADGTSISWQAGINTASTFNKTLMYEVGLAQGEENKLKGINAMLGPCVNMMRSAQGGRIWESFGNDPYLSGVAAEQVVKGIQDAGVIATIKHFVTNDQETYRKASSSNLNMATLMDIYVEPFYRAIKYADCGSVMSSYNAINNTYVGENKFILTDVLRNILGFKGFVMSDWWEVYSNTTQTINSGLDVNMPGGSYYGNAYIGRDKSFWSNLEQYVQEGNITEERITEAATRIIATMYKLEQMENYPEVDIYYETKTDQRKKIQRQAATESQILLKNDGILPLTNFKTLGVIGSDAFPRDCINGDRDLECRNTTNEVMNGHIPLGYGSGTTYFDYLVTPLDGITKVAEEKNITILSSGKLIYEDEIRGLLNVHVNASEDINSAIEIAAQVEAVIIFASADSGEEYLIVENTIGDRPNLNLWHNADELITQIADVNPNVIVVINAPAVVNMPWMDKVRAIIFSGFPGAESGNAVADVLFGNVNPSGHLPYAWYDESSNYQVKIPELENLTIVEGTGKSWKDIYRYDGVDSAGLIDDEPGHDPEQVYYNEGLYVGQRWFNKNNEKPVFPFGFGLSYTKFNYNDLQVSLNKEGLKATFKVKNIEDISGSAVPMMFITFPNYIGDYPAYILKGFEKVEINPGETKTVTIIADDHALSYFDVSKNNYVRVNRDKIKVSIGENGDPEQSILNAEIDASF